MEKSWRSPYATRRYLWPVLAVATVFVAILVWSFSPSPRVSDPEPSGPPWLYGRLDARFTVIAYADLECPYCQAYFPVLKQWIDSHPEANWQWHHLPLAFHEPAATQGARLVECAGEVGGRTAFWHAIAWVYQHTRGDGQGVSANVEMPGLTPAVQACLDSTRPDAVIRAQADEAAHAGVVATPSLRLVDNHTGTDLLLPAGPIEGDALLSAIDLLTSAEDGVSEQAQTGTTEMPADLVGDMPR